MRTTTPTVAQQIAMLVASAASNGIAHDTTHKMAQALCLRTVSAEAEVTRLVAANLSLAARVMELEQRPGGLDDGNAGEVEG